MHITAGSEPVPIGEEDDELDQETFSIVSLSLYIFVCIHCESLALWLIICVSHLYLHHVFHIFFLIGL